VPEAVFSHRLARFATFEVDLQTGELRKAGVKLKLTGQPFQVLVILLERPGEVVTREELQKRLWPDTFVDVDHNLNTAINKIREVLSDQAENPRFVETLPRRGYRFIAAVDGAGNGAKPATITSAETAAPGRWILGGSLLFGALALLAVAGWFVYKERRVSTTRAQRTLTRLTFDAGLQTGPTWSPDGRFIAYSSNRGGKFDIWVQQLSGGDPVQITKGPGHNWQPDWSPDGKYIAYRSEDGDGGLFVVPALGGEGLARKIAAFGYYPRWSPDSSQILLKTHFTGLDTSSRFYVVNLDGAIPREVCANFVSGQNLLALSAAWHPDGKRVSIWGWDPQFRIPTASPSFWTVPFAGGTAVKSEIAPEIVRQLTDASLSRGTFEWAMDFKFSWAPSGNAIYFERTFRGARNIWRMSIDPKSLRAIAIERMTTGPGLDTQPEVSPDGRKVAFTGETQHIRAWVFPFNATLGRVTGPGQAVTVPGVEAWRVNLSRDGKRLAFCPNRAGKLELWEKRLPDGRDAPVANDNYRRDFPQWSPDGTRLAYRRENPSTSEAQLMVWSSQSYNEEPLTAPSKTDGGVFDWSADGKRLLITQVNSASRVEIFVLPVAAAPHAEAASRKIISDQAYDFYQPHFSPDDRWIVFEGVANSPTAAESTLYVMPAAGGPWTRITDGKHWDDKPRWSPDGRKIYFVSGRGGFFNVWGIHLDFSKGKPVGEPFRVTAFENPAMMLADWIPNVGFSLTQDKLVLTMEERSGSIWVLDNVDR
jgi:Tol biopolymer transport system component/DNA-binding winged helix-turn-helix (wHTH) protein